MIGVTLRYQWITKNVYLFLGELPGPDQRPAP
jgi:hypothetical protein